VESPPDERQPQPEVVVEYDFHEVKPQETLWRIARMYGMTAAELQRLNQLPDNTIQIGARLRVAKNKVY